MRVLEHEEYLQAEILELRARIKLLEQFERDVYDVHENIDLEISNEKWDKENKQGDYS